MCMDAPYFIILLCLTPDDSTCQRESAATQWVKIYVTWKCIQAGPYTVGGGGGGNCPPDKTIFTIFRMSLLIILWIFGTFLVYSPYCPPPPPHLVKKYGPVYRTLYCKNDTLLNMWIIQFFRLSYKQFAPAGTSFWFATLFVNVHHLLYRVW
jgi:hypothetical protein